MAVGAALHEPSLRVVGLGHPPSDMPSEDGSPMESPGNDVRAESTADSADGNGELVGEAMEFNDEPEDDEEIAQAIASNNYGKPGRLTRTELSVFSLVIQAGCSLW